MVQMNNDFDIEEYGKVAAVAPSYMCLRPGPLKHTAVFFSGTHHTRHIVEFRWSRRLSSQYVLDLYSMQRRSHGQLKILVDGSIFRPKASRTV